MSDKMSVIAKMLAFIGALTTAVVLIALICKKLRCRKKRDDDDYEKAYLDLDEDCDECFLNDDEDPENENIDE